MEKSSNVILPTILPMTFDGDLSIGRVSLPTILPMIFSNDIGGRVSLPAILPMNFTNINPVRKSSRLNMSVICNYIPTQCSTKLQISQTAVMTQVKLLIVETAWDFKGLILEENIVAKMNRQITILEEVRARILTNTELVDKNHIKIKWYGDSVPQLDVMKKVFVDENYTKEGTYNWDKGEAIILIDDNEYNVQLVGVNGTGESGVIDLGESSGIDVFSSVNIALNEKIYDVEVSYTSEYKIEVNY